MTVILLGLACLLSCALVELIADDCPTDLPEFEDLTEGER